MERYFNDDQIDHMRDLASLPPEKRSPCGWATREECDRFAVCGSCVTIRAKAGLPAHPSKA